MKLDKIVGNGELINDFDNFFENHSNIISEEYLYKKFLFKHRLVMKILIWLHLLLLISLVLSEILKFNIQDESMTCKCVYNSKIILYIISNIIFILLFFNFWNRPNSTLNNIIYYQNILKIILLIYIMPILIISQKFIPYLFCKHSFHNNLNIIVLGMHIFIENIFIYYYVKCLIEDFKTFGNFKK